MSCGRDDGPADVRAADCRPGRRGRGDARRWAPAGTAAGEDRAQEADLSRTGDGSPPATAGLAGRCLCRQARHRSEVLGHVSAGAALTWPRRRDGAQVCHLMHPRNPVGRPTVVATEEQSPQRRAARPPRAPRPPVRPAASPADSPGPRPPAPPGHRQPRAAPAGPPPSPARSRACLSRETRPGSGAPWPMSASYTLICAGSICRGEFDRISRSRVRCIVRRPGRRQSRPASSAPPAPARSRQLRSRQLACASSVPGRRPRHPCRQRTSGFPFLSRLSQLNCVSAQAQPSGRPKPAGQPQWGGP